MNNAVSSIILSYCDYKAFKREITIKSEFTSDTSTFFE